MNRAINAARAFAPAQRTEAAFGEGQREAVGDEESSGVRVGK
jgi:hypothetical protein